ncbi:hypothetical protein FRC15_004029, partial [Serendipita sp. 397]
PPPKGPSSSVSLSFESSVQLEPTRRARGVLSEFGQLHQPPRLDIQDQGSRDQDPSTHVPTQCQPDDEHRHCQGSPEHRSGASAQTKERGRTEANRVECDACRASEPPRAYQQGESPSRGTEETAGWASRHQERSVPI